MKLVATFNDSGEAYLLRAHLEGSGLTVFVRDDHTVSGDLGLSNAFGGVKVEVPEEDYAAAVELLAAFSKPHVDQTSRHSPARYVKMFSLLWLVTYLVLCVALLVSSPPEHLLLWLLLLLPCAFVAGLITFILAMYDR